MKKSAIGSNERPPCRGAELAAATSVGEHAKKALDRAISALANPSTEELALLDKWLGINNSGEAGAGADIPDRVGRTLGQRRHERTGMRPHLIGNVAADFLPLFFVHGHPLRFVALVIELTANSKRQYRSIQDAIHSSQPTSANGMDRVELPSGTYT